MKAWISLIFCAVLLNLTAAEAKAPARFHPYDQPITQQEEANTRYIINTLSSNSYLGLLFHKKDLERAGEAVSYIHPLKFIAFIFTDPQLKRNVRKISGTPWRRFVEDTGNSLNRSTITQKEIDHFSKEVNVDPSWVEAMVRQKKWASLINGLKAKGKGRT